VVVVALVAGMFEHFTSAIIYNLAVLTGLAMALAMAPDEEPAAGDDGSAGHPGIMSNKAKIMIVRMRNLLIAMFPSVHAFGSWLRFAVIDSWRIRKSGLRAPLPRWLKAAKMKAIVDDLRPELFVETGTYLGDTVWLLRNTVKDIVSIEVEPTLARVAQNRFRHWGNVRILTGDSGQLMRGLVDEIRIRKAVFWLDGHYSSGITGRGSSDCPIIGELTAILPALTEGSLIIIDDARCFTGEKDYPSIESLRQLADGHHCQVRVDDLADHILIARDVGASSRGP
jgi:hypothetical protein